MSEIGSEPASARDEPPPGEEGRQTPWARRRSPSVKRVTPRRRQPVQDLPDWEPLPPGESLVRRPRH